jgi:hypothetical protein
MVRAYIRAPAAKTVTRQRIATAAIEEWFGTMKIVAAESKAH